VTLLQTVSPIRREKESPFLLQGILRHGCTSSCGAVATRCLLTEGANQYSEHLLALVTPIEMRLFFHRKLEMAISRCVDQTQPDFALGPAAARAGKTGCNVALEPLFRKRAAMAKDAGAGSLHHQRSSARGVAGCAGQRGRDSAADNGIRPQCLRIRRAAKRDKNSDHICDRPNQRCPP